MGMYHFTIEIPEGEIDRTFAKIQQAQDLLQEAQSELYSMGMIAKESKDVIGTDTTDNA